MDRVIQYTKANLLAINPEKTLVMLQTKDQQVKDNFSITLNRKEIKHKTEIKVLGNLLTEDLTWDLHVTKLVIPALKNRIQTLRLTNKYLGPGFRAIYTNSVFRSKLMFGLETWGGESTSPESAKYRHSKTRQPSWHSLLATTSSHPNRGTRSSNGSQSRRRSPGPPSPSHTRSYTLDPHRRLHLRCQ